MSLDLNNMSDEALVAAELSEDKKLVAFRFDKANNQNVPALAIRSSRKLIARIHTELRRREIERGAAKGSIYTALAAGQSAGDVDTSGAGGFLSDLTSQVDQ